NHGVAFGINVVTPRPDGSRVDFEHKVWPIEFVRRNATTRSFYTTVDGLGELEICHGDGRWTIYHQNEHEPWKHGAIMAAGTLWADHAFGLRDGPRAANAHGNAKSVGALPEGIAIQDKEGNLTKEAKPFLELLRLVASADTPVG